MANTLLNPRTYAQIGGITLIAIALTGTVMSIVGQGYAGLFCSGGDFTCEGKTAANGSLLGFDWVHNGVHWLLGFIALYVGFFAPTTYAGLYAKVFGGVYLALAIVGFIPSLADLGILHLELIENIVHAVLGVAGLVTGFFGTTTGTTTPTTTANTTGKA